MQTDSHTSLSYGMADAGKRLGICRSMVYKLLAAGELKSFSVGSRVLIAETELQRFVAHKMAGAA